MFNEDMKVCVGEITMRKLVDWASHNERFASLTTEAEIQKAFTIWKNKMEQKSVTDFYIEVLPQKIFEVTFKQNLAVIFARAAVEGFFDCGKTLEELIANDDWINNAVNEAIDTCVAAASDAAELVETFSAIGFLDGLNFFKASNYDAEENCEDKFNNP